MTDRINHNNVQARTQADWFRIRSIKEAMTRHFMAMQSEVHLIARELDTVDADQFMTDWRANFDPYQEGGLQDLYDDTFHATEKQLHEVCADPSENRSELSSGVCKPMAAE